MCVCVYGEWYFMHECVNWFISFCGVMEIMLNNSIDYI